VRYTQASYIPDIADGVVRGFVCLVTDITERKRIEDEVERSRRLAEAERVAHMGSWEWDIVADGVVWSDGLCEIYGIRPEEHEAQYRPGGSEYVHAEDRDRVDAEVRRTVETCTPIDFEYRVVRPDGRLRRLHSRAEVIVAPDGSPLRLTGTVQDVTELRAARRRPQQRRDREQAPSRREHRQVAPEILHALGVANRAQAVARYLAT
jgi:PAS domain S-box-containing protein